MRIRILPLSVAAVLALSCGGNLLQAQAPDTQSNRKTYGYQDPQTGQFHALPMSSPIENASTTSGGTLKVVINITVKSTFPTGTARTIVCSAQFEESSLTSSSTFSTPYIEEASRYATATGTAGSFTCTLTIPYSWLIPSGTIQNSLTGSYSVGVQNTATTVAPALLRMSSGPIVSTSTLPAPGTTTTYTIAATI